MKKIFSLVRNIVRSLRLAYGFTPITTVLLFALTILTYLAPLLQAGLLGSIINKILAVIEKNALSQSVLILILTYAGVWVLTKIADALKLYIEKIWHLKNEKGLEVTVLKKRAELDIAHYESPKFQDLLHRAFNRGIWPVFELADFQFNTIANIAVILASSIITAQINPLVYIVVLITSIPSFIVQIKYGHTVWGIWAENSPRQRKFYSMRTHLVNRYGATQTKLLQNSVYIIGVIENILDQFMNENLRADKKRFYLQVGANIVTALGFGFSFWMITQDVMLGAISIGSMVFVVNALGQLIGAMNSLLRMAANQFEKNLYVDDIFKVLDTKPYIVEAQKPIKLNLETPPRIEIKNLGFKYEDREDWILKNINLTIEPGEKIALVGMNGAGKSTLTKLLARIYDPTEGDIFINGVNLKDIGTAEWGSYVAILLQDYLTYDMNVAESIAMGRASIAVDMERVENSAKYSGAHEFIVDFPNQYGQQLGKEFDGGIEPSKGQQQKIALARTIYRDAFLVILDEPTAAIDSLSEEKIFQQMENAVGKNSLILITHRFNTTKSVDRIVVLDKGKIKEIGNHKELLAKGGIYKKMFESQAKTFLESKKQKKNTQL